MREHQTQKKPEGGPVKDFASERTELHSTILFILINVYNKFFSEKIEIKKSNSYHFGTSYVGFTAGIGATCFDFDRLLIFTFPSAILKARVLYKID